MAPPPTLAALLATFRAALESRFGGRLREMRLFGSYARGDARPDVDVLVVVDDPAAGSPPESAPCDCRAATFVRTETR